LQLRVPDFYYPDLGCWYAYDALHAIYAGQWESIRWFVVTYACPKPQPAGASLRAFSWAFGCRYRLLLLVWTLRCCVTLTIALGCPQHVARRAEYMDHDFGTRKLSLKYALHLLYKALSYVFVFLFRH
jgi:hypothetical protein